MTIEVKLGHMDILMAILGIGGLLAVFLLAGFFLKEDQAGGRGYSTNNNYGPPPTDGQNHFLGF